jgi:hypothetical protein
MMVLHRRLGDAVVLVVVHAQLVHLNNPDVHTKPRRASARLDDVMKRTEQSITQLSQPSCVEGLR